MTLVSQIIADAYRETNITATGAVPTTDQQSEGLRRLQALVLSCIGNEAGFILEDWNLASAAAIIRPSGLPIPSAKVAAFTVKPNSRLICNLTAASTFKLDPLPQDGQRFSVVDAAGTFSTRALTVNPNGRRIEGAVAPLILETNFLSRQWFYRSDIADWVRVDTLEADNEMPFPVDFDDYFITTLAMRINPAFGKTLTQETKARLDQQKAHITARYSQTRLNPSAPPSN